MTPDEEAAYEQGRKAAALSLLRYALGEVGTSVNDDLFAQIARFRLERGVTVIALRHVCADYGDNDWPDNLHLADVVEKHLERPLRDGSAFSAKRCPSCESKDCIETPENEEFTYDIGDKAVKLTAKVVLITCQACREAWTDERGEDARSDAVTHYLQRRVAELEEMNSHLRFDLTAAKAEIEQRTTNLRELSERIDRIRSAEEENARLHVDLSKLTETAAKECGRLRAENARMVEAAYAVFHADPGTIPAIAVLRAAVAGEP